MKPKDETVNYVKYKVGTWCRVHPALLLFAALSTAVYVAICHEQLSSFHIWLVWESFQHCPIRL